MRFGLFPTWRADAASDTAYLKTLERLFVRKSVWRPSSLIWSASSLGMQRLCVVTIPAFAKRPLESGPEVEASRGPAVSDIPNYLQICSSVSESASVKHKVGDIPGCTNAGFGNVPEHSICWVFRSRSLDKIYYKFPHIGRPEGSWLIDRRVKVCQRALLRRSNSNRLWKSLL